VVGFMGAGKTSVGKALGRRLGWTFQDLDDRIEALEGRAVGQIFRDSGEMGFRKAETAALSALLSEGPNSSQIVALGGGALSQPENLTLLLQAGADLVFLDAPVEELRRRCEAEPRERPLRGTPDEFHALYQRRLPSYLRAGLRIDTNGKDIETVAAEVACSLKLGGQDRC